jgi:hypothetical protein
LTTSQRAEIAARMATAKDGKPAQDVTGSNDTGSPMTNEEAASKMGVSVPSVKRAKKMLEVATPSEVKEVKAGKKTVSEVLTAHEKPVEPTNEVTIEDANGRTVPEGIVDAWQKATTEGNRLTKMLHEVKLAVQRGVNDDDPTFTRCHNSDVADFDRVYYKIKNDVTPHVVCTTCQGLHAKKCKHCYGTGWLTMFQWKNLAEDIRKLAEKTGRKA